GQGEGTGEVLEPRQDDAGRQQQLVDVYGRDRFGVTHAPELSTVSGRGLELSHVAMERVFARADNPGTHHPRPSLSHSPRGFAAWPVSTRCSRSSIARAHPTCPPAPAARP